MLIVIYPVILTDGRPDRMRPAPATTFDHPPHPPGSTPYGCADRAAPVRRGPAPAWVTILPAVAGGALGFAAVAATRGLRAGSLPVR